MFKHLRPAWAEVDLDKLAHNMREIRRVTKSKKIMAVVKADAYGHGAVDVAPVLLENGADSLAVAMLSEAMELRRSGIECPIMILGFTPPELIDNLLKYNIEQTVFSYEFAKQLSKMAQDENKIARIHIALDTGMGRIGFLPSDESVQEVYKISLLPNVIIEGIFCHFSTADEKDKTYTNIQVKKFDEFYQKLEAKKVYINTRHIANSAAIIDLPKIHYEAVRPGIIIYGYYPSDEVNKEKLDLLPAMTLKTNVVHIKTLPPGECVGYGREYKTDKESVIATLPIGYADGYTRLLFQKAKVIIKGKFAPVIGKICMDQCMIDITRINGVKVGDEVILIGEDENNKFNADVVGGLIGTISYEIVCMIGKRVPRVYIKEGEVVKIKEYV
ncbi:alanine racemase [Clostridium estertheticum]|uniref:Alanine racemase n=2 Tax=Clostridium estertheticum TaxID=238834 RepID=A0A1J0GLC0_9CLOT|nr:alanine racemase [Clostridium estertheticum]APC42180.1 alanine racemase [Clostridium estertheticum subsp. estertheticum]MBU3073734.1 alanine racemase [Clostridium estertheticum]MBU3163827.1 alanine racemase [Clostridium estertheticum]MBU3172354.1 alanine racemase [Clostridium estertheticum]MBU3184201.1 alanine racemase [Clostridium estertheticum]